MSVQYCEYFLAETQYYTHYRSVNDIYYLRCNTVKTNQNTVINYLHIILFN